MSSLNLAHGIAMAAILFASPALAESPLEMLQNEMQPSAAAQVTTGSTKGKTGKTHHASSHLEKQTAYVSTGCFNGALRGVLSQIGQKFGGPVIVTSGYRRSRTSYHGKCMAADIQIAGVSPGAIFAYARSLPAVGGTGRYGHTRSVHVDVAPRKFSWGTGRKRYAALGGGCCPDCATKAGASSSSMVCTVA
jgi:Peptidase M15